MPQDISHRNGCRRQYQDPMPIRPQSKRATPSLDSSNASHRSKRLNRNGSQARERLGALHTVRTSLIQSGNSGIALPVVSADGCDRAPGRTQELSRKRVHLVPSRWSIHRPTWYAISSPATLCQPMYPVRIELWKATILSGTAILPRRAQSPRSDTSDSESTSTFGMRSK
jgi:hypothetical protein